MDQPNFIKYQPKTQIERALLAQQTLAIVSLGELLEELERRQGPFWLHRLLAEMSEQGQEL